MTNLSKHNETGFTLVELAIALMVIGLLIGGVLKGQELVENARITRVVKDLNDFDTAVMIFRSSYGGFPGDLRDAGTRLPNCDGTPTGTACNNAATGIGDGQLGTAIERSNFWRHLSRAGLLTSINESGTEHNTSPKNSFGGYYAVAYQTAGTGAPLTGSYNFYKIYDPRSATANTIGTVRLAAIDTKMDDGKPLTGSMLASFSASGNTNCHSTATPVNNGDYLVADAAKTCTSLYKSSSMN